MFSLRALQKNKTVKYGVPMLFQECVVHDIIATVTANWALLVVGGSFGLREFTQLRYDEQRIKKKLDPSLEARVNIQRQSVILEEEYEKIKELNLEEWKNIRGPRPWEDSKEYQEQQRTRLNKKD